MTLGPKRKKLETTNPSDNEGEEDEELQQQQQQQQQQGIDKEQTGKDNRISSDSFETPAVLQKVFGRPIITPGSASRLTPRALFTTKPSMSQEKETPSSRRRNEFLIRQLQIEGEKSQSQYQIKVADLEAKLAKTEKDRKYLWTELETLRSAKVALETSYSGEKADWAKVKADLEGRLMSLEQDSMQKINGLYSELRKKDFSMDVLQGELKSISAINEILGNQVKDLKKLQSKDNSNGQDNANHHENDIKATTLGKDNDEIGILRKSLDKQLLYAKTLESENRLLKSQLEALKVKMAKTVQQEERYKTASLQLEQMRSIKDRLAYVEAENQVLQSQMKAMAERNPDILVSQLSFLKKEHACLVDKFSSLKLEKQSIETECQRLAALSQERENQISMQITEKESLQSTVDLLQRTITLRDRECSLLRDSVSIYERELSEPGNNNQAIQEVIEKYQKFRQDFLDVRILGLRKTPLTMAIAKQRSTSETAGSSKIIETETGNSSASLVSDSIYCDRLRLLCKEKLSAMREFIYLILGFKLDTLSNGEYRLISRYSFTPEDYFSFVKKTRHIQESDDSVNDVDDGISCGNGWFCTRVPQTYEQSVKEVFGHGIGEGKVWPSVLGQITLSLLDQITQYL